MPVISWIHISDLHFHEHISWDASVVLKSLINDIAKLPETVGIKADFAVVSGDIGSSGKPREYESARTFFDKLRKEARIRKNRLFVIPGNHDVSRNLVSTRAKNLQQTLTSGEGLNEALRDARKRTILFERLQHYYSFIKSYFGEVPFAEPRNNFKAVLTTIKGVRIAIFCLNSVLLSKEDGEKGKLCVGEYQARALTEIDRKAILKVGIVHHPLDWLSDFDSDTARPVILKNVDFLLHGHVHSLEFLQMLSPDFEAVIIGAGAAYETRFFPNSYNIVSINTETCSGNIWFRTYRYTQGGLWDSDSLAYRGAPKGVYTFPLSSRLNTDLKALPRTKPTRTLRTHAAPNVSSSLTAPQIDSTPSLSRILDALKKGMDLKEAKEFIAFHLRERPLIKNRLTHLYTELALHRLPNDLDECLMSLLNALNKSQPRDGTGPIEELLKLLKERRIDIYETIIIE